LECLRTTTERDHYEMKKKAFISFTEYLIFLLRGTFTRVQQCINQKQLIQGKL